MHAPIFTNQGVKMRVITVMNRRSVLKAFAGIGAGAGAIFGSGAFASVEATRSVNIQTSGDSSAQLGLSGSGEIMTTESSGGTVIKLDDTDLNNNAVTRYNGAIDVTNNGESQVSFTINDPNSTGTVGPNANNNVLDFEIGSSSGGTLNLSDGDSVVTNSETLSTGETVTIDIVINNKNGDVSNLPGTIEFVAN